MATGSGKTFTACTCCYRLIKFAKAKRILFLVDRNNLGKQALNEFQQYVSPYNNYKFTEEYNGPAPPPQHHRPGRQGLHHHDPAALLDAQGRGGVRGGERRDLAVRGRQPSLVKEPLPVVYNPQIPIETFDFIIIDECHRSIYNVWRQVLEYFDAFLIGLTATPTAQTLGFFNGNLVQDYSHEKAVADGVNVGYDVYRIETKITKDGATLAKEPGIFVPAPRPAHPAKKLKELDDDLTYTANELDRDVVADGPDPAGRPHLPRPAVHRNLPRPHRSSQDAGLRQDRPPCRDIVKIIREEFGRGNDFCQKITSKTTGKKPDDLLNEFRNSYNPRIAVTVDMIATGTDVKPLECLLFMRNINSASLLRADEGPGLPGHRARRLCKASRPTPSTRPISSSSMPWACASGTRPTSKPLDRKPSVPLDKILNTGGRRGGQRRRCAPTLAARLTRLDRQIDEQQRAKIAQACRRQDLGRLTRDCSIASTRTPTASGPSSSSIAAGPGADRRAATTQAEQEAMQTALKPFHNPKLREAILASSSRWSRSSTK